MTGCEPVEVGATVPMMVKPEGAGGSWCDAW